MYIGAAINHQQRSKLEKLSLAPVATSKAKRYILQFTLEIDIFCRSNTYMRNTSMRQLFGSNFFIKQNLHILLRKDSGKLNTYT